MINLIKIMRQSLESVCEGIIAQYGIEATLPKGKGTTGDPIYREYLRGEKRWKKIREYEGKVNAIQERIHIIKDEREYEVLHWLLEGKSIKLQDKILVHVGHGCSFDPGTAGHIHSFSDPGTGGHELSYDPVQQLVNRSPLSQILHSFRINNVGHF